MDNIVFTSGSAASNTGDRLLKREFRAMGSQMMALLQTNAPFADYALAQVPDWFEGWEQQLSRFRPDSELSLLNDSPGRPMPVSEELWEVLQLALAAADDTGGLVTPAVLNALEAAGYDRSFETLGSPQSVSSAASEHSDAAPGPAPDWREIGLEPHSRAVRLPPGLRLDFGGIAKGWAADRAAAWLARWGPALVDAGGDIAVNGPMAGGAAWPIGVSDPGAPDQQIELLGLYSGGVATSGRDYRRWQRHGRERSGASGLAHHIIDPRTGEPATTDVLSATVVAPSASAAEVAAKTALILGSQDGLRWLDGRPELWGLLVLEDGQVLRYRKFAQHVWK